MFNDLHFKPCFKDAPWGLHHASHLRDGRRGPGWSCTAEAWRARRGLSLSQTANWSNHPALSSTICPKWSIRFNPFKVILFQHITKASLLAGVCFPLGMYWGQSFWSRSDLSHRNVPFKWFNHLILTPPPPSAGPTPGGSMVQWVVLNYCFLGLCVACSSFIFRFNVFLKKSLHIFFDRGQSITSWMLSLGTMSMACLKQLSTLPWRGKPRLGSL